MALRKSAHIRVADPVHHKLWVEHTVKIGREIEAPMFCIVRTSRQITAKTLQNEKKWREKALLRSHLREIFKFNENEPR